MWCALTSALTSRSGPNKAHFVALFYTTDDREDCTEVEHRPTGVSFRIVNELQLQIGQLRYQPWNERQCMRRATSRVLQQPLRQKWYANALPLHTFVQSCNQLNCKVELLCFPKSIPKLNVLYYQLQFINMTVLRHARATAVWSKLHSG